MDINTKQTLNKQINTKPNLIDYTRKRWEFLIKNKHGSTNHPFDILRNVTFPQNRLYWA